MHFRNQNSVNDIGLKMGICSPISFIEFCEKVAPHQRDCGSQVPISVHNGTADFLTWKGFPKMAFAGGAGWENAGMVTPKTFYLYR